MRNRKRGNFTALLKLCGLVLAITISTAGQQAPLPETSAAEEAAASGDSGCAKHSVHAAPGAAPSVADSPCARSEVEPAEQQASSSAAAQEQQKQPGSSPGAEPSREKPADNQVPALEQPKRILGVMPNFRAVTAGALPPPPTAKESFILATENSFDYSSFIFVGFTSALAEWTYAHPPLGQGMAGYGRYYWRGLVDKTDGNYLVLFALPTVFHQDERYFTRGKGGFWRRFAYAGSRVFVTPNYQGHDSFNYSELLGRGMAQGLSVLYYPSQTRTFGAIGAKFGYAIMRDALTNIFREFWPDIDAHVLHHHPKEETH